MDEVSDDDDRVTITDLGDGRFDGALFLPPDKDRVTVAEAPKAADGDLSFLAANPSNVTGLPDDGGGLGLRGSGVGGGGAGIGIGLGNSVGAGPSTSTGTVLSNEVLQNVPISRDYDEVVTLESTTRSPRHEGRAERSTVQGDSIAIAAPKKAPAGGKPGGGGRDGKSGAFAPPEEEPPLPTVSFGAEEPDQPVVTAASMSVVVPDLGETVLFQAVLLPKGSAPAVIAKAKRERHRT